MDALGWPHLAPHLPVTTALRRSSNFGPYAVLFDTGFYATSFGPAMPFLAAALGVSLGTAGFLLTAVFAGSITASGLLAWLGHTADQRRIGIAGLVLIAAGMAGLGLAPYWWLGLASALLLGIGDGLTVAAAHMLVAAGGGDLPRAMSRLNVMFAIGAALGPLWAGFVLAGGSGRAVVYCAMIAVPLVAALSLAGSPPVARPTASIPARGNERLFRPLILAMGGVLLIYVGAEIGLGTWVSSYTKEAFGSGVVTGALVTAGYWAMLGVGRLAGTSVLARGVRPHLVLAVSAAGALAASLLLTLASGTFELGAAGALLAGLCFGPIWGCALGIASQDSSPRVPAVLVTIGNAGGLVLPVVQGAILDASGPRAGMTITAVLCAAMLALAMASRAPQPSDFTVSA